MDKFEQKLEYFQQCEDEQIAKQRAKLAYALRHKAKEEAAKYRDEHKQGYCPHCFILLTPDYHCDCCGYTKEVSK